MEEPTGPRRYTDMTEGERIEAADKTAVFEWLEEQTKGMPAEQKRRKVEISARVLEEFLERLDEERREESK